MHRFCLRISCRRIQTPQEVDSLQYHTVTQFSRYGKWKWDPGPHCYRCLWFGWLTSRSPSGHLSQPRVGALARFRCGHGTLGTIPDDLLGALSPRPWSCYHIRGKSTERFNRCSVLRFRPKSTAKHVHDRFQRALCTLLPFSSSSLHIQTMVACDFWVHSSQKACTHKHVFQTLIAVTTPVVPFLVKDSKVAARVSTSTWTWSISSVPLWIASKATGITLSHSQPSQSIFRPVWPSSEMIVAKDLDLTLLIFPSIPGNAKSYPSMSRAEGWKVA